MLQKREIWNKQELPVAEFHPISHPCVTLITKSNMVSGCERQSCLWAERVETQLSKKKKKELRVTYFVWPFVHVTPSFLFQRVKYFTFNGMHQYIYHPAKHLLLARGGFASRVPKRKKKNIIFSQRLNAGPNHTKLIIKWTAASRHSLLGVCAVDRDIFYNNIQFSR